MPNLRSGAAGWRLGLRQPAVCTGVGPAQDIGCGKVAVRGRRSRPMTRVLGEMALVECRQMWSGAADEFRCAVSSRDCVGDIAMQ
jgi:hypothetical protein